MAGFVVIGMLGRGMPFGWIEKDGTYWEAQSRIESFLGRHPVW
jgi:hypothetical protein